MSQNVKQRKAENTIPRPIQVRLAFQAIPAPRRFTLHVSARSYCFCRAECKTCRQTTTISTLVPVAEHGGPAPLALRPHLASNELPNSPGSYSIWCGFSLENLTDLHYRTTSRYDSDSNRDETRVAISRLAVQPSHHNASPIQKIGAGRSFVGIVRFELTLPLGNRTLNPARLPNSAIRLLVLLCTGEET